MLQRLDGKGSSTSKSTVAAKKAIAAKKAKTSPVTTESMIGKGMQLAMNQIYDMTLGAGINAATRQGDVTKLTPMDGITLATMGLGTGMITKAAPVIAKAAAPMAARQLALNALKNPQVAMQMGPEAATSAIKSGEFKNAFQLGEDAGVMPRQAAHRAESEKLMGIPMQASGAERPKYGFLTSPLPRAVSGGEKRSGDWFYKPFKQVNNILSPENQWTKEYIKANRIDDMSNTVPSKAEGVVATFKPSVAKNTTYTRGDSNPAFNASMRPEVFNPNVASKADMKKFAKDILIPFSDTKVSPYYIEAQIFGKLGIDDVKKFVAGSPAVAKQLRSALQEVGKNTKVTLSNQAKLDAIKSAISKLKPKQAPQTRLQSPEG